jgi:Cu(I)/Ag(I) efflux system periplasmic protein CusF
MRKNMIAAATVLMFLAMSLPVKAQSDLVDGQVTKIDQSAGKITIKHGPIKSLDMNEAMTMVFRVQDPGMLKQVKPGDKIKFSAERVNGAITVTKIQK